jgi:hypothetical protein
MTHALGFSSSLFKNFIDKYGVKHTNATPDFVGPNG